jgi:hypothetical protein
VLSHSLISSGVSVGRDSLLNGVNTEGFEHVGCAVVRGTLLLGQDRGLAALYHRAGQTVAVGHR